MAYRVVNSRRVDPMAERWNLPPRCTRLLVNSSAQGHGDPAIAWDWKNCTAWLNDRPYSRMYHKGQLLTGEQARSVADATPISWRMSENDRLQLLFREGDRHGITVTKEYELRLAVVAGGTGGAGGNGGGAGGAGGTVGAGGGEGLSGDERAAKKARLAARQARNDATIKEYQEELDQRAAKKA